MSAILYQIYYEDSQKAHTFPFAHLYFNESLTIFFENDPIKRLVMAAETEKIAVCSWKLKEKLRWYIGKKRPFTQELLESDYDVLPFTKNSRYHQMLGAAEAWHPGFRPAMQKICDAIGVFLPSEVKIPIYQNHFSARTDIYQDYVKTYLVPAMDAITFDREINAMAIQDSKYSELDGAKKEKLDELEKKIGLRFYPMAPFLLERLFSIYVHNKKINVTYL
jgi:hypothetical protein